VHEETAPNLVPIRVSRNKRGRKKRKREERRMAAGQQD